MLQEHLLWFCFYLYLYIDTTAIAVLSTQVKELPFNLWNKGFMDLACLHILCVPAYAIWCVNSVKLARKIDTKSSLKRRRGCWVARPNIVPCVAGKILMALLKALWKRPLPCWPCSLRFFRVGLHLCKAHAKTPYTEHSFYQTGQHATYDIIRICRTA